MTTPHELMADINATLKSPVLKMASDESLKVTYIPTGVLPIDSLLQGGIPRGRFTTITGDWSTLKSYVGLSTIAQEQFNGGTCALIDTEHSFDPEWATQLVVDVDSLMLSRPESGEMAIDAAETLIRGGATLVVFDSVAAALPEAERDKRLHKERVQPARTAALMSVAMRKLTAANTHTAMIWVNQLRMNVGVTFGNPEVATGGRALPFYSSYIVNIKKTGKVTRNVPAWDGEKWIEVKETYAQKFRAYVEKSKLSSPHREVHFTWDYEANGVDEIGYLIACGLESGHITQKGAVWTYDGQTYRGKDKFKEAVRTNSAMQGKMRSQALPALFPGSHEAAKSKADKPRKPRSKTTVRKATRTRAQGASSTTAVRKRPSSK